MSINWSHYQDLEKEDETVIARAQHQLLLQHLEHLTSNSPYYSRVLKQSGFKLSSIRSLDDIRHLPVTDKDTIAANWDEMAATAEADIVDLCQTSGTTGAPINVPMTQDDLDRLEWNEYQALRSTGINNNDRVLIACSITRCFMAGLAYFMGVKRLGATAIRSGADNAHYVLQVIEQTRPTAMIGVPSLLMRLATLLISQGKTPSQYHISRIVCIGEPIRDDNLKLNKLGEALSHAWGATLHSTYASTEIASAFCECEYPAGGHPRPELCYTEILDEQNHPLPPGEWGEVTITPFGVKGFPLLRFKTGDISRIDTTPCACGRNTFRLAPIAGRRQQMLKVKGCTVYPNTILTALKDIPGIEDAFIEAHRNFDLSETVKVVISTTLPELEPKTVSDFLTAKLRFHPLVEIQSSKQVAQKIFDPAKRKPIRFFDHRSDR